MQLIAIPYGLLIMLDILCITKRYLTQAAPDEVMSWRASFVDLCPSHTIGVEKYRYALVNEFSQDAGIADSLKRTVRYKRVIGTNSFSIVAVCPISQIRNA